MPWHLCSWGAYYRVQTTVTQLPVAVKDLRWKEGLWLSHGKALLVHTIPLFVLLISLEVAFQLLNVLQASAKCVWLILISMTRFKYCMFLAWGSSILPPLTISVLCFTESFLSPGRIPFAFLEDIHQRFVRTYGRAVLSAHAYGMNDEFSRVLSQQMEYYTNDPNADRINRLKGEMSQVSFRYLSSRCLVFLCMCLCRRVCVCTAHM